VAHYGGLQGIQSSAQLALDDDYTIRQALMDTVHAALLGIGVAEVFGAGSDLFSLFKNDATVSRPLKDALDAGKPTRDTNDAAFRTGVAQIMEGRPLDIEGFYKPQTALGAILDNPSFRTTDRDVLARQANPDLFKKLDTLNQTKTALTKQLDEVKEPAERTAIVSKIADNDAAIQTLDSQIGLARLRAGDRNDEIVKAFNTPDIKGAIERYQDQLKNGWAGGMSQAELGSLRADSQTMRDAATKPIPDQAPPGWAASLKPIEGEEIAKEAVGAGETKPPTGEAPMQTLEQAYPHLDHPNLLSSERSALMTALQNSDNAVKMEAVYKEAGACLAAAAGS
jgi:hypothetical protein